MGQTVSRSRPQPPQQQPSVSSSEATSANAIASPPPESTSVSTTPCQPSHRRSTFPRRLLSSFSKPSLRTRSGTSRPPANASSSPVAGDAPRGGRRRWRLSRKHRRGTEVGGSVNADGDDDVSGNRARGDGEVNEFGVLRNDNEPAVVSDRENLPLHPHSNAVASTSASSSQARPSDDSNSAPTPATNNDQRGEDEVVIAPTDQPSLPSIQLPSRESAPPIETTSQPAESASSQGSSQVPQAVPNNARPFPSPGTLVVVQGVVHTTDVERVPEGSSSSNANGSAAPNSNSVINANARTTSRGTGNLIGRTRASRASSVPPNADSSSSPGSSTRNRLSSMLSRPRSRPSSMLPVVPSSPPNVREHEGGSSHNITGPREGDDHSVGQEERQSEASDRDEREGHLHEVSTAQGPAGASGLSASSIDVLGTLLSVAAAATAASLLTGSSEPVFSSGLAPSPPHQSHQSPPTPISTGNSNSNVPTERPLSPTPSSDAGRMRHVWSSLRDRLGLGGHNNSGGSSSGGSEGITQPGNVTDRASGTEGNLGQEQPGPGRTRSRDAREVMLAEMARAFNLGLGLGPVQSPASPPSSVPPAPTINQAFQSHGGDANGTEFAVPIPPPDSFERFLMDLQTDLRIALTQEQEAVPEEEREHAHGDQGDGEHQLEDEGGDEENESMPDLRSLSDSDSSESERQSRSHDDRSDAHEGEDETEETVDAKDDECADDDGDHISQEQFTSAVSTPGEAALCGAHTFEDAQPPQSSTSAQESAVTNALDFDRAIATTATEHVSDTDNDCDTLPQEPRYPHADVAQEPCDSGAVDAGLRLASDEELEVQVATRTAEEARDQCAPVVHVGFNEGESPDDVAAVPTASSQGPSNAGSEPAPGLSSFVGSAPLASTSVAVPSASIGETTSATPVSAPAPVAATSSSSTTIDGTSNSGTTDMPFRLPSFTPGSASRTERTPGGGINWWRMYRFPAIASPVQGGQGQSASQSPANLSWLSSQTGQNGNAAPRGEVQGSGALSGTTLQEPSSSSVTSSATAAEMSGAVSTNNPRTSTPSPVPQNGSSSTNESQPGRNTDSTTTEGPPSNVVVPVIVVGLQSVNMDRRPSQPHPEHEHYQAHPMDDGGEGLGLDGFGHPIPVPPSMPMHFPEPPELPDVPNQQPRGRRWPSRAVNAIRNLRPTRRGGATAIPQPAETPGSRTFLIYVIGGYYPPEHQIITGGNLDSFEALWELAELLGQVKPPTVSKEEIEKSGLEVIKGFSLEEYEKDGRVASNCVERCLICLDDYTPEEDLRVLSCRHVFHRGCVDRWLETGRNNCPACRSKGVNNEGTSPEPAASTSTPLAGPPVT